MTNAVLISFALSVAAAQVPVGVVRGSVHDELGDAMPGATITVSGGGREVKAVTDIEGRYRVEVYAAGTFVVTVALEGFAPAKCGDLNIAAVGSEARCDVEAAVAANVKKSAFSSMQNQEDAPPCTTCGSIMVRSGACYKCPNCGTTSGCA